MKLSSIFDVGSTGLPVDIEMSLGKATAVELRKAMNSRLGRSQGETSLQLISGNILKGNCVLWFKFQKEDGTEGKITYEFCVKRDGVTFLNATCNPTVLLVGGNAIPVVIKGRSPYETFQIMNRLPYQLLEEILDVEGFVWKGKDKKRLADGDLNLKQLEIAFYSGDLGKQRPEIMRFLRTIYGGLDSTVDKVFNLAEGLDLEVQLYDKNDNMRITAKTGNNPLFSLVLYHKDKIVSNKNIEARVKDLIRYDCTFHYQFLFNNKINKIHMLEAKYRSLCGDEVGKAKKASDKNFVVWLRNKVIKRIKLDYIMGIDRSTYFKKLKAAEEEFADESKPSVNCKVFWAWRRDQNFDSQKHMADKLGVTPQAINKAYHYFQESYGFDMAVSRSYMEAMFFNSAMSMISSEERGTAASFREGDNRDLPSFSELHKRASKRLDRVRMSIREQGGLLSIRKMTPYVVKLNELHIHKCMGIKSNHVWGKRETHNASD